MKILMLSGDPEVLKKESTARLRMTEYAYMFDSLHIIALTGTASSNEYSGNLFLYPAYARNKLLRRLRGFVIARRVLLQGRFDVLTVQGPDEFGLLGYFLAKIFRVPFQ